MEEGLWAALYEKMDSFGFPLSYGYGTIEVTLQSYHPPIRRSENTQFLCRHIQLEARCVRPLSQARAETIDDPQKIKDF